MITPGGRRSNAGHLPRTIACVIGLLTISTTTACEPSVDAAPPQASYTMSTITPDGTDQYVLEVDSLGLTVRSPAANVGGNLRVAVVDDDAPVLADQQACVSWHGPAGSSAQPGVVLRSKVEPGRTRAIVVTNNVVWGYRSGFNVHLVDTDGLNETGTGPGPYVHPRMAGFDMRAGVGDLTDGKPSPWRICARVVGSTLTVKAWSVPAFDTEPSWSDPTYAQSTTLPSTAGHTGRPGIYVGHLSPGDHAVLKDLDTGTVPAAPRSADPSTTMPMVVAAVPAVAVPATMTAMCQPTAVPTPDIDRPGSPPATVGLAPPG